MGEIVIDSIIVQRILKEYGNMVYQIVYQNVLNYSDAEDITQETFIKL